ncbi:hypothetical protein TNCV_3802561 [Trichonephila clavipes]|nr:hypothetical protein TNCV_3802561 [Trichonephila clavipes]
MKRPELRNTLKMQNKNCVLGNEISASDYDWQAFDPTPDSDFRRSVFIVDASGVPSKFNGDLDTNKCC